MTVPSGAQDPKGSNFSQHAEAHRDALTAGRDIHLYGAPSNRHAPSISGGGLLWPPLGRLPECVRGRDVLVDHLSNLLETPDGRVHALSGLGGTGKSTVALRVAEAALDRGQRVWWVSAVDAASVTADLLSLAQALGADTTAIAAARAGQLNPCDVLWSQLDTQSDWLLVIDNADDLRALTVRDRRPCDGNGWVRGSRSGLLLVTTRDSDPLHWGRRVAFEAVGCLTDTDGARVLLDLAPYAGTVTDAENLSNRLGGLALALHHAGSHLALPFARERTFAAYQRSLETNLPAVLGAAGSASDREIVTTTWELSLDELHRLGTPQSRGLLGVLAWFAAPVLIPSDGIDDEILGRVCYEPGSTGVAIGLRALSSAGLIETQLPSAHPGADHRGESGIVLHPLVAEITRHRHLTHGSSRASAAVAVDLLTAATCRLDAENPSDWPTWFAWLPHVDELLNQASSHLALTEIIALADAAVRSSKMLLWAGSYPSSLKMAESALQHTKPIGPAHPSTLRLLFRQASASFYLGRYTEAERLYRVLLTAQHRVLGPEHPDSLNTANEIAWSVAGRGDFIESEHLYRTLLPTQERVLGTEHPDTLGTRYGIARSVAGQGRHIEAERLYHELIPVQQRVRGPEHPYVLTTQFGIAESVAGQGRHHEAERLYRDVHRAEERVLGPHHPHTLNAWYGVASSLAAQGEHARAERLLHDLLPIQQRVLGPNHGSTQTTARMLRNLTEPRQPDVTCIDEATRDDLGMIASSPVPAPTKPEQLNGAGDLTT
ncbi:tetratricopeptide repeat protein [Streptomyces sp. NPDC047461]|uniref:tetratricopeptide repeat protein n=1 Tax=Streptomyces sp. NPDC047461 TaxID=3155619 RepID=UPI0034000B88